VQHADDGYSRGGKSGGSLVLVRNTVLIYLLERTNVYGSRGVDFKGIEPVYGVESCKIAFLGGTSYSLVQILLLFGVSFNDNAQRHRQTDGQTTMPIAVVSRS